MEGRIVRITMENFITYRKAVFTPGQHLNVIVGANGSGKSTIVCAMLLGLGGKVKCIGRATGITSYIRTDCKNAKIEIELHNPKGDNYVITRIITADNKSSWMLQQNPANQEQVKELITRLNIQVDNLCQFLPQDKVAEFSGMNAQELLVNTEKCVGPPEMSEYHMKLKDLCKDEAKLARRVHDANEKLNSEQQKNNRLQVDVDSVTQRNALLEELKVMKQKRAWLQYDIMKTELNKIKRDKVIAEESLRKHEIKYEPMSKIKAAAHAKVKEVEQTLERMSTDTNRKLAALKEIQEKTERTEDIVKDNYYDYKRKVQAEEMRQKDVNLIRQQILKLQNDLKNASKETEKSIQDEIDAVQKRLRAKDDIVHQSRERKAEFQSRLEEIGEKIIGQEKEQQKVQDLAKHRLELLRSRHKDVYEAVKWLRENRNKFRHNIFEPMMLEINVTDASNAKYVEQVISRQDLIAFTCEDKEDMNSLLKTLREEKNLKINVVHSGNEHPPSSSFKSNIPMEVLRKYGFHTFIADMISAPEPIMKYLCRQYHIHKIPVGNSHTLTCFEKVPIYINSFFADQSHFSVSRSKYTGATSTRTTQLHRPSYLAITINSQNLEEISKRLETLKEERQDLLKSLQEVQMQLHRDENEMERMRMEKKQLNGRLDQQRTVQARINAKRIEFDNLEKRKVDPEILKAESKERNQKLLLEMNDQHATMIKLVDQYDRSLIETQILQQDLHSAKSIEQRRENESRELLKKCENTREMIVRIKENLRRVDIEVNRLYEEAKQETNGLCPRSKNFEFLKCVFADYADTEEELDKQISDVQAKADCLGNADEVVIREYRKREQEIAKFKFSIEDIQAECEAVKKKMTEIKEKWLPPLQELVTHINNKYGHCCAQLGCAGEVTLVTGDNEDDYEQYGLRIKVKFRDGAQLQDLNKHTQSGGERAVATAIYMISLQELTKVPFCCVDEINQGMDASNERLIFQLLVKTTQRVGNAQYFFISPKLLPPFLYADPTITVHCVYNGDGAIRGDQWDVQKFIKKKAVLNNKKNKI